MAAINILPLSDVEDEQLRMLFKSIRDRGQLFIKASPGNCILPTAYEKYKEQIYNFKTRPDDIFILTWPKNGSTWTQEMVWYIQNDCNFDKIQERHSLQRFQFIEFGVILDHLKQKPPGKSFNEIAKKIEESASPRIIKSHLPYSFLPPNLLDKCKVVTCLRNPKDTLVSYYHHDKLFRHYEYIGDFESFFNLFMDDLLLFSPYWDYTLEAWKRRNHPNLCLLFFEDMKKDLEGCIRKVAKFLQKDLTGEQVKALEDQLTFKAMKENNKKHDVALERLYSDDIDNKQNNSFLRKGEVGDWKNYFTEEMNKRMDEAIDKHFKGTGLEFRYI